MVRLKSRGAALLVSGSGLLAFAAGALAQTLPPLPPPPTAETKVSDENTEQIIVTARKRSESIQDAPVAVSAFSAAALDRQQISNLADLSLAVPGMLITQTGGSANAAQVFIRGFGQDALGFNSESPIGMYFDGVYLGRVQGALVDLLDIERIEVLRGPQGTLYGRNSTTGAVKIVPRAPNFANSRVIGDLTTGSFNRLDFRVSASTPLADNKAAAKFDFVSKKNDGYIQGVNAAGVTTGQRANGADRQIGRLSFAWAAAENVLVDFAADVTRNRSGPLVSTPIICVSGANSACVPRYGNPYYAGLNLQGQQKSDSWGYSAKVDWALGTVDFKSITAYRGFEALDPIDLATIAGAPNPIIYDQRQRQFSQEFQLTSNKGGAFDWVAGVFYFKEKWKTDSNFVNLRRNLDEQSADSVAAFGEVNFKLSAPLTLTLGARVTKDTKSINRKIFNPRTATAPTVDTNASDFSSSVATPKVALDYKLNKDSLLYVSWGQGYRPGGYGSTWPGNLIAAGGKFEAEKMDSIEVGYKLSWLQNRASLNLSAYQSKYKNLQQGLLTPTAFNIVSSDAEIKGLEAEFSARLAPAFLLYGNIGFLENKITRSSIPGDNLSRKLRYAPKSTYKIGAEYKTLVRGAGSLIFGSNIARVSRTPMDNANSLSVFMDAYTLVDAQVVFEDEKKRYKLILAGKNLTDVQYWRSGIGGSGRFYAAPKTWSLGIQTSF